MARKVTWILAIVLLLMGAILALPFLIPLDHYKQVAVARVKALTGRDLVIAGNVKASFWPNIGVTLQGVSLSNPEGFTDKTMADIDELTAQVALLPLLHGEIAIKEFILSKPVIHLEVAKDGTANWQFAHPDKQAAAQTAPAGKSGGKTLPTLGEMKITDGAFTYRDLRNGSNYSLSDLSLEMKMPAADAPLDVTGSLNWNKQPLAFNLHAGRPFALLEGGESALKTELKSGALLTVAFDGQMAGGKASGALNASSNSLVALSGWLGKPMKGPTPLAFAAQGQLAYSAGDYGLSKAALSLDAIKATGDIKIATGKGAPMVTATLAADTLDLNPYLPKPAPQASLTLINDALAAEGWSNERIDFSGLRAANANVTLTIGSLIYKAVTVKQVALSAKLADGALALNLPHLGLYGGTADVAANVNANGAVAANVAAQHVQIEPLLKDAAQFDRLSGTATINANITTQGASQRDMVAGLGGKGNVQIADGAIRGIDLAQLVRNAKSIVTGADTSAQKTDFSELGGSFTIAQGIVTNKDLAMKAPLLRVKGDGTVDLPQRGVHYLLTPSIVGSMQGQGGKEKDGIDIPIIVAGSFDHLTFTPDLQSIAQTALQNPDKIKDTVKDIRKSLKEQGGVKNLLQGLGR